MTAVTRLVTIVDIQDQPVRGDVPAADLPASYTFEPGWAPVSPGPHPVDPRVMSLSAVHLAVLADGRRLTLLDDRGWTTSGPPDLWRDTSIDEITATARVVVGPDEPFDGHAPAEMAADPWAYLVGVLGQHGVHVDAGELIRVPHDVELSDRLRIRLGSA